jgi:hypothetical protein
MMKQMIFGFGVVDKNNRPYTESGAISHDREDLQIAVDFLNSTKHLGGNEERAPFRVVDLIWIEKGI